MPAAAAVASRRSLIGSFPRRPSDGRRRTPRLGGWPRARWPRRSAARNAPLMPVRPTVALVTAAALGRVTCPCASPSPHNTPTDRAVAVDACTLIECPVRCAYACPARPTPVEQASSTLSRRRRPARRRHPGGQDASPMSLIPIATTGVTLTSCSRPGEGAGLTFELMPRDSRTPLPPSRTRKRHRYRELRVVLVSTHRSHPSQPSHRCIICSLGHCSTERVYATRRPRLTSAATRGAGPNASAPARYQTGTSTAQRSVRGTGAESASTASTASRACGAEFAQLPRTVPGEVTTADDARCEPQRQRAHRPRGREVVQRFSPPHRDARSRNHQPPVLPKAATTTMPTPNRQKSYAAPHRRHHVAAPPRTRRLRPHALRRARQPAPPVRG